MNKVSIDYPNGGRTVTVRIGRFLDCSVHSNFNLACELAEQLDVPSIVVDLDETPLPPCRAPPQGSLFD